MSSTLYEHVWGPFILVKKGFLSTATLALWRADISGLNDSCIEHMLDSKERI